MNENENVYGENYDEEFPKLSYKVITPGEAERLIESMRDVNEGRGNRTQSPSNMSKILRALETGSFDPFNGETITTDDLGRLIDGEHRLTAIRKYGKPVILGVISGVRRNAFLTINTGKTRGTATVLEIIGRPSANSLAAVAVALMDYDKFGFARTMGRAGGSNGAWSNVDVSQYVEDRPELDELVREVARLKKNVPFKNSGRLAVLLTEFRRVASEEVIQDFLHKWSTGEMLMPGDAALALRKAFDLASAGSGRGVSGSQIDRVRTTAFITKAFNAHRNQRSTPFIKWDDKSGKFPEA